MSKSAGRHLVRLRGKLNEKEKKSTCCKLLYFSVFQSTSHKPISVAELGCSVNHAKPLISCLQNRRFFKFFFDGCEELQTSSPPGGANELYFCDSTYH